MVSYEKSENVQSSVFQKHSIGRFLFFSTSNFLITFEKIHKAQFFSTMYIFCILTLCSATNRDQKITFDHIFLWQNLLFRQNIYIYLFKKCHTFLFVTNKVTFPKKISTFLRKCHCTNFFRANCY